MSIKLLEDLKKYLDLYPRVDRKKWEAARTNAIAEIQKELDRHTDDLKLFDQFWNVYPRKQNKPDAKKAWRRTINARPELSTVISAVLDQCKSEQWMQGFIPHASTWLRGHGWNDKMSFDLPGVHNEKPWHETASGIEAKGKEYGLDPSQFATFPEFRAAVMQKSLKAA
jgi:hypothetical protein